MKRIAIPVTNRVLSAHFGHCEQFYIYDIENSKVINETRVTPPPHEPGLLPKWLREQDVTDVIAGGMGQRAIDLFITHKINVFVGAPITAPTDLVQNQLNGSLKLTGNCCDH